MAQFDGPFRGALPSQTLADTDWHQVKSQDLYDQASTTAGVKLRSGLKWCRALLRNTDSAKTIYVAEVGMLAAAAKTGRIPVGPGEVYELTGMIANQSTAISVAASVAGATFHIYTSELVA